MALINWWSTEENGRKELSRAQAKLEQYRASLRLASAEMERRSKAIRSVTAFIYQSSRLNEPAALLKTALTQALDMSSGNVGAIVLIDPESKTLQLGAHKGITDTLIRILTGRQLDRAATVIMPHLVVGEGILVEETSAVDEDERLFLRAAGVAGLVALPLQAGQQLFGALVIGRRDSNRFSRADLDCLLVICQAAAVALDSLHLREKLWRMAEKLLEGQSNGNLPGERLQRAAVVSPALLPPLQIKLSQAVSSIGGAMGVIFSLRRSGRETTVTLVADYGLSPVFTTAFAHFRLADAFFPFERLDRQDLLIRNLSQAQTLPIIEAFKEEGAKSLLAVQFDRQEQGAHIIMIAGAKPDVLTAAHIVRIRRAAGSLLPLLADTPLAPTFPLRSVHVPAMEAQAKEDDLEKLLAAVMAAEEEVERHNADLAALNLLAQQLNRTLDLEQVWGEVLAIVRRLLSVDAVWLHLVDTHSRKPIILSLEAHDGLPASYSRAVSRLSLGDHLEGLAAGKKQPQLMADVRGEEQLCHLLLELTDLQAVIAAPLVHLPVGNNRDSTDVIGVLSAGRIEPHSWQMRESRLITSIANQMSLSIHNARLYARLYEDVHLATASNRVLQEMSKQLMVNQTVLENKLKQTEIQVGE